MKFIYHGNLQSLKDAISANAAQLQRNITIRENAPDMWLIGFDLWGYDGGGKYFVSHIHEENGYVTTIYGRRRYLPELKVSNFTTRSFGERVARNMPIQGTAADIMKLAMVHVHRKLKDEQLQAKMILQVHDELIIECPEHEAQRVSEILKTEMERVAELTVPLTVDAHIGRNWMEAKG